MHKKLLFIAVLLAMTTNAYAEGKLIFAIDIIRHGDRTPVANIPTVKYNWPEGFGQLTPTGMHQEYELGKKQRAMYVNQYHLLPAQYKAGTVYVRASDFDRTLMSGQSFLMGLYPLHTGPQLPNKTQSALPEAYQPIPLHTIPQDQETMLIPDTAYYKYNDLLAKYVYPLAQWQQKTAELQPKFAAWSQATGINI